MIRIGILCLILVGYMREATAQQEQSLVVESDAWVIALDGPAECRDCLAGASYRFTVTAKSNGRVNNLSVENLAQSMSSVSIYRNVAAFIGELPAGGRTVSVYDLSRSEKISEFYSYDLFHSPDRRYFIYRKFFPRFSSVSSTNLLIYDLETPAADQRRLFGSLPPAEVGIQFHPIPPAVVPEFSLASILWRPDLGRALLTVIDESEYHNLLTLELWGENPASKDVENCYIPFAPLMNTSSHARGITKNVVESLTLLDEGIVEIKLAVVNGVASLYRVNYQSLCP